MTTPAPKPRIVALPPPPPAPAPGLLHRVDPGAAPPVVEWLITNVVAAGCVTVLAGEEKSGKSRVVLQWASAVAPRIPVAIVDAENGSGEIQRRLALLPCKPVVFEARGIDIDANADQIERLLRAGYRLLILDTLSSLWSGNDTVRSQVKPLFEGLRTLAQQYNAGILVLTHTTKANEGMYRGSGAIGQTVEVIYTLTRGKDRNDRSRTLTCRGMRIGPEPKPVHYTVGDDGMFRPAPPPTPAPATTTPAPVRRTPAAPRVPTAREISKLVDQGVISKRQGRRTLEELGHVQKPWWRRGQ